MANLDSNLIFSSDLGYLTPDLLHFVVTVDLRDKSLEWVRNFDSKIS